MIRLENDYTTAVHPEILARLSSTNLDRMPGHCNDDYCKRAAVLIKKACNKEDVDVHFMVGGTIANLTIIAASLRPHEAVVSANTGHIFTSETGAIEATGHKVLTVNSVNGKMIPEDVRNVFVKAKKVSAPKPGMIYLSQSTERGTVYSLAELKALRAIADEFNVPLFIDGARLGYALASPHGDATLADIASLCDVFYIGGTKVGAMFGEAVVISNPKIKEDFKYIMKQKGALLAKGRLLGLQFEVLFENGLYHRISKYAVDVAQKMSTALTTAGYELIYPVMGNQIFVKLPNKVYDQLAKSFSFKLWQQEEDYVIARFCTDWSTTNEHVETFIEKIKKQS